GDDRLTAGDLGDITRSGHQVLTLVNRYTLQSRSRKEAVDARTLVVAWRRHQDAGTVAEPLSEGGLHGGAGDDAPAADRPDRPVHAAADPHWQRDRLARPRRVPETRGGAGQRSRRSSRESAKRRKDRPCGCASSASSNKSREGEPGDPAPGRP